jgi:hypothetical protein
MVAKHECRHNHLEVSNYNTIIASIDVTTLIGSDVARDERTRCILPKQFGLLPVSDREEKGSFIYNQPGIIHWCAAKKS